MTSERKRDRAASVWVEKAIDAGMNPQLVVWSDDDWSVYTVDVGSGAKPMPDGLDECIKQALLEKGRVLAVGTA